MTNPLLFNKPVVLEHERTCAVCGEAGRAIVPYIFSRLCPDCYRKMQEQKPIEDRLHEIEMAIVRLNSRDQS